MQSSAPKFRFWPQNYTFSSKYQKRSTLWKCSETWGNIHKRIQGKNVGGCGYSSRQREGSQALLARFAKEIEKKHLHEQ